jgi:hypothetical protein
VVINVPVFLLSIPFWDVCIDQAKVGEPEILNRGYQSNSYPDRPNPTQAMVLVWTRSELSTLVQVLDGLFIWLVEELRKPSMSYVGRWAQRDVSPRRSHQQGISTSRRPAIWRGFSPACRRVRSGRSRCSRS